MIPNILHFVWLTLDAEHNSLPDYAIRNLNIALLNTAFDIYIHSNKNISYPKHPRITFILSDVEFTIKGIPFVEDNPKYSGKNGKRIAHISDIFRLEVLYKYGGVYSDFDVLWLRNPWEYMDNKLVIGYSNKTYKILCNAVMMSEKEHPCILEYKNWLVDIYPCPKYWIPANPYKLWKDKKNITFVDKHIFFPIKWNQTSNLTLDKIHKSIAVHEFASNQSCFTGEVYDKLITLINSIPKKS